MKGTLVNTAAIIIGGSLGNLLGKKLEESLKEIVMQALSLAVLLIGSKNAIQANHVTLIIFSLILGGIIGELLQIEYHLEQVGVWLESWFQEENSLVLGFVRCSLIYCIGAMAIMGAIQDGLQNDPSTLYAKSLLDGFSAIAFASTLGVGVIFSAISVFIYQGSITLLASWLQELVTSEIITAITATGGLLIIAIGLNLLEVTETKIKVGNLLPALFIIVILVILF